MIFKDPRIRTCSGEDAELIIPPHPDLDEYPEWLKGKALERFPKYKGAWPDSGADAVSHLIQDMDAWDWLDHWGTAVYDGQEFLVSEPYDMNREKIDQLLGLCDALKLAFSIQSSGHHYPTLTMRILVWPKEWPMRDEFCHEDEGYADHAPSGQACLARSAGRSRPRSAERAAAPRRAADPDKDSGFALEEHLRDYLAKNLRVLEDGMTLWPVDRGQRAVEFRVNEKNRRIDILARDASGIPTVIETKVHRGHERTVGQVLFYQDCVRRILKMEKVRVLIVAKQVSTELKAATARLPDVSLIEYSGTKTFRKL
jgi:hypothetical protein